MGDDQAGLLVAERLQNVSPPNTAVMLEELPGAGLADETLGEVDLLIVVDAARADCLHSPGSFRLIDYHENSASISAAPGFDTHTLGVTAGLDLAAALGVLPPHVWIYVLFGETFHRRLAPGRAVEAAIPRLVRRIRRDVERWLEVRSCTS